MVYTVHTININAYFYSINSNICSIPWIYLFSSNISNIFIILPFKKSQESRQMFEIRDSLKNGKGI